MLKKIAYSCVVFLASAHMALALPEVGKLAPDFQTTDINGNPQSIGQYRGNIVVVEWNNPECPFVKKHYGSGNMQKLQADATAKNVIWLTINSSAAGKQGAMSADEAKAYIAKVGAKQSAYILDASGEIGRNFDAKTTPHMYVVDAEGILAYMGAIDDKPTFDQKDIDGAKNYVTEAINALQAGTAVADKAVRPYGCAVKYAD